MSKEEIKHPDGLVEHVGVRYERRDIRFGWILALVIAACLVGIIHFCLIWKFYGWQKHTQEEIKKTPYRLAPTTSMQLPPEPRLEQLERMVNEEKENLFKRLLAKEKMLHSYGPTEEKGFVHIPIEQAMKTVAGELPVRNGKGEDAVKDEGLIDSGESNSGRMFRGTR